MDHGSAGVLRILSLWPTIAWSGTWSGLPLNGEVSLALGSAWFFRSKTVQMPPPWHVAKEHEMVFRRPTVAPDLEVEVALLATAMGGPRSPLASGVMLQADFGIPAELNDGM